MSSVKENIAVHVHFVVHEPFEAPGAYENWVRERKHTSVGLHELAAHYNPALRGWLNYYGRFYRSALQRVFFHFDGRLLQWARRKYRNLRCNVRRRQRWRERTFSRNPWLFTHWTAFGWVKVRTMGAV